jgi:hypothetical protein
MVSIGSLYMELEGDSIYEEEEEEEEESKAN